MGKTFSLTEAQAGCDLPKFTSIISGRAVIKNSAKLDENMIRDGVKLLAHGLILCNSTDFI